MAERSENRGEAGTEMGAGESERETGGGGVRFLSDRGPSTARVSVREEGGWKIAKETTVGNLMQVSIGVASHRS